MSSNQGAKSRRGARQLSDHHYTHRKATNTGMQPIAPSQTQMPYYAMPPHSYFHQEQPAEHIPYMPPFVYQQALPHSVHMYHNDQVMQLRDHPVHGFPVNPPPSTPPLKRVRTDTRCPSSRASEGHRRTPLSSQRGTPSKNIGGRKTFSDFRISSIHIGAWSSDEAKDESDVRDSRVRFCFRNSNDQEPDSTLSAAEAALTSPDRLSISVCRGSRRIVIPAHHIKIVKFSRRAGHIEIETDGWAAFETATQVPTPLPTSDNCLPSKHHQTSSIVSWELTEEDVTEGQLAKVKVIKIELDQDRPLTEPKWTRGSLADHIDVNSRFLKIIKIMDGEVVPTFKTLLDQWAGDDTERTYFCEYQLTSSRLLNVLTTLMSSSNVLTPAILCLLESLLAMIQSTDLAEEKLMKVLSDAVFLIPHHMLRVSLDTLYNEFVRSESPDMPHMRLLRSNDAQQAGGSKRQRGESEVPSEQLARTTLDEKRRRLSESDPQLPNFTIKDEPHNKQVTTSRSKSCARAEHLNQTSAPRMRSSGSQDSAAALPAAASKLTISVQTDEIVEDGTRMSREEMLRALEDCEDHIPSSDVEADTQDVPVSSSAIVD